MTIAIKQLFINQNRSGEAFAPQGVVVHATATKGATAQAERNYFNSGDRGASAHAFVDWAEAIQCIPWGEKAWHCMNYGNNHFIGIELCEPAGHNVAQFNAVWNNAVDVFAQLFLNVLHQKIVTKDNLLSHAEVSARWHETDHTDPVGYFAEYGKTVDQFRADVQARINAYSQPLIPEKQFNIHMIANVQNIGLQNVTGINDVTIGTVGKGLRMESIEIDIDKGVNIIVDAHIQNIGTVQGQAEGQMQGTIGQALRLEAVIIHVKEMPQGYKLQYQAHVQNIGWMPWVEGGQVAGTEGKSLRMEALRVRIIKA